MVGLAAVFAGFLLVAQATAQDGVGLLSERAPDRRPSLLLLAMSHLHNPGQDAVKAANADVLAAERQREIEQFVRGLGRYKPTHIAIEHVATDQGTIDRQYAEYLAGQYALSRDEQDQIGFRLAKLLGLREVHAVDWNGNPPGDPAAYGWDDFAERNGQGARLQSFMNAARALFPTLAAQNITDWILDLNRPERLVQAQRLYYDVAFFGSDTEQPGAAWLGSWYARNLRIFRNLVTLTDRPEDRVLVIFGASHAYPLRRMAEESGAFRLRELQEFVSPAGAPAR